MRSHRDLSGRSFYAGLLEVLIQVMGSWNGYLYHHGPRVACVALRLGRSFHLSEEEQANLFFASVLADVGMIGLVEGAWENPAPTLDDKARLQVRRHPRRSAEIVRSIPYLESVQDLVFAHHEWWDGSGYPRQLRGEDIPLSAQILRLADTVAALGEARPQRGPLEPGEIRKVVGRSAGAEFSPEVARRFDALCDQGEIETLNPLFFEYSLLRSLDVLVPGQVSPVSSHLLLDLFAGLVDAKDPYTGGHSRRVASLARAVARKMELPGEVQEQVWAAGFLHDMGKVSVPLRILTKRGPLTSEEFKQVQRHTSVGARITGSIPSLRHLAKGCRYHHERWDGQGYPEGISQDRIPLTGQILAVADSYDAMTSGRAYRASYSHGHALEEIDRSSGIQFGPRPAGAFLTLPYDFFQEVKRLDPGPCQGDILPFEERFRRHQKALLATG